MTIFNTRTILIFSVCLVNTYIATTAYLDVINLGEVRYYNFDNLCGLSEPLINFYFERLDPFMVELQSYNYGASNPTLWIPQDVIDHVNENLRKAKLLLDKVKELRSAPSYPVETFADFLKRIPTYQEVANGTKVFHGSLTDIRNLIGDFTLYIRPDQFPPELIEGANRLRETLAREALEKGHTTQEILNNTNSIKIKHPSDGNTVKFILQTAYQEGTTNPSYRFMIRS